MLIPPVTGEKLKEIRKRRLGLTQAQLGRVLDVSNWQICQLERRGEVPIPPLYALAVAQLEKMHREAA